MEVEAEALLSTVERMLDYWREREPHRFERPNIKMLDEQAVALRQALSAALSNPGEDVVGKTRAGGRETSKSAALEVMPRSGTQRMKVLEFIATCEDEGATDEDVRVCLDMRYSSENARRLELVEGGWVKDSGRTRPTDTGNQATVWILTSLARSRVADGGIVIAGCAATPDPTLS